MKPPLGVAGSFRAWGVFWFRERRAAWVRQEEQVEALKETGCCQRGTVMTEACEGRG